MNVELDASSDLVSKLRESIFIETSYLAERLTTKCSSLDGPACFSAMMRGTASSTEDLLGGSGRSALMDGPGVLPERLLHDLGSIGADDLEFATPEYSVLEAFRGQLESAAAGAALPMLTGPQARVLLQQGRSETASGILHFHGLVPDTRVPLTFSRGLPHGTTATWDGRWLVRGCGSAGASVPRGGLLALPAPDGEDAGGSGALDAPVSGAPVAVGGAGAVSQARASGHEVSVTAELAGSVGYIRFSRPVVVRSLFARWLAAGTHSQAVVGGRLGLESVWTTHLDPDRLREGAAADSWLDVAGGTLRPVDEVAILAAPGFEVGALDVAAYVGSEEDDHAVMLLSPISPDQEVADGETAGVAKHRPHKFKIGLEKLSSIASPYIMSVQEVIERGLRILPKPREPLAGVPAPTRFVDGLRTAQSPPLAPSKANVTWAAQVGVNQAMYDHSALAPLLHAQWQLAMSAAQASETAVAVAAAQAVSDLFGFTSDKLPKDLQKELSREQESIMDALLAWVAAGGKWHRSVPSVLPYSGSEEALGKYAQAKRQQTKLDLLTAAFLHMSHARRSSLEDGVRDGLEKSLLGKSKTVKGTKKSAKRSNS